MKRTRKYLKVEQLENKNQFVVKDNEKVYFQSYDSLIAIYERATQKLTLGCDWNYSNTTRKHLYIFIDRFVYGEVYEVVSNEAHNKRKAIQKLIDQKVIKYDKNMY